MPDIQFKIKYLSHLQNFFKFLLDKLIGKFDMKDYYLILGIDPSATTDEVKTAFRKMSLKYHPDKNSGDKYFEERFKDLNEAYQVLINIEKRLNYDYAKLSEQKERTANNEFLKKEGNLHIRKEKVNSQISPSQKTKNTFIIPLFFGIMILFTFLIIYSISKTSSIPNESKPSIVLANQSKPESSLKNFDLKIQENYITKSEKPVSIVEKEENINKTTNKNFKNSNFKNVEVVNLNEIKIVKLVWENFNISGNEKILKQVSIFNETLSTIGSIEISFKIFESDGTQINSGRFILNERLIYHKRSVSDETKYYHREHIEPQSAKKLSASLLDSPSLKTTETIVLKVESFTTIE